MFNNDTGASWLDDQAQQVMEKPFDDEGNLDLSPEPLPLSPKPLSYPVEALGPVLAPAAKRLAYHI